MRDNHYEARDYTFLKSLSDKGESLLKAHHSGAFRYILHNVYDAIYHFDASFALKLYNNMKEYEIHLVDDNDESIYDKALSRYQSLMDEYFQNVIVDINEHHGFYN